jgi:hypothetical protein
LGPERRVPKIEMMESRGCDRRLRGSVCHGSVWLATTDSMTANRQTRAVADLCNDDSGLRGLALFPYWFTRGLHDKLAALWLTTLSTYCVSFTSRVINPPSLASKNWLWKSSPRS